MATDNLINIKINDNDSVAIEPIKLKTFSYEEGRSLEEYSWGDLNEKIKTGSYNDLRVGDYKTFTFRGKTVTMLIAGIDTYYNNYQNSGNGSEIVGHHIDWISKELVLTKEKWNDDAKNNSLGAPSNPYVNSKLYNTLNAEALIAEFPDELKNVIVGKYATVETRKDVNNALTNSTGRDNNVYFGLLWVPTEMEVFGSCIHGTPGWSCCGQVQYPLFAYSTKNRCKGGNWWLATPQNGSNTHCVAISANGNPIVKEANSEIGVPLCFRMRNN